MALQRRGQIVHSPQRRAPIQMPQRAIRANSHGIGALASVSSQTLRVSEY